MGEERKSLADLTGEQLLEVVVSRLRGRSLRYRLAEVVRTLEAGGVSQVNARRFLQSVFADDRRAYSAEFHRRLREVTPLASTRKPRQRLVLVQ